MHLVADPSDAEQELRAIARLDLGDHLRFEITRSIPLSVPDALKLKTAAYTGTTLWDTFDIDVSCERHFVAEIQSVRPAPVLDIDDVLRLPAFRLYPLVDQIADKIAAMYEKHGLSGAPSNRYRDLVDLALLIGAEEIEAGPLLAAMRSRKLHARNPVMLPTGMQAPGPGWLEGYRKVANRSSLDASLHRLDDVITFVGFCLNPILDGSQTTGRWNPTSRSWTE